MKKFTYLLLGLLITTSVFAYRGCIIKLENHTGDPALVKIDAEAGDVLINSFIVHKQINMAGGTSVTLQTTLTPHYNASAGYITLIDRKYPKRRCQIDYYGLFSEVPSGGLQIDIYNCNIPFSKIVSTTPPCSGQVKIGDMDKAKIA